MNETLREVIVHTLRRYNYYNQRLVSFVKVLEGNLNLTIVAVEPHNDPVAFNLLDQQTQNESYYKNVTNTTDKNDTSISSNDHIESMSFKICFDIVYLLIFVLGLIGNALVCFVVARNSNMHTVTNIFIANLALSDILLCLFAVPFTWLYLGIYKEWFFGKVFCHILPFAQGVSVYISTFTLMSIAFDRYFVIIHPFRPRMQMRTCVIIIGAIWLLSGILMYPYAHFANINLFESVIYCQEAWPYEETKNMFGIFTCTMQFLVPFIIIALCYYKICSKLWDRAKTIPGNVSVRREEQERDRTRKTNWMLISMVVIFVVSWLPLNIYNLLVDFCIVSSSNIFFVVHAVAMSSTCYNPFLYAWLNENFRKEFKQILPCCFAFNRNLLPTTIVHYRKPRSITVCRNKKNGVSLKLTSTGEGEKSNETELGNFRPLSAILRVQNMSNANSIGQLNHNLHGDSEKNNSNSNNETTSNADSAHQVTSDSPLPTDPHSN